MVCATEERNQREGIDLRPLCIGRRSRLKDPSLKSKAASRLLAHSSLYLAAGDGELQRD